MPDSRRAEPPTDPAQAAHWGPLPWEAPADSMPSASGWPRGKKSICRSPWARSSSFPTCWASWRAGANRGLQRREPGLRRGRRAGQRAGLERRPRCREPVVQRPRHRAQDGVRDRHLLRPSSQPLQDFPLYDQIDDNDIEAYRRRYPFDDFGVPPPLRRCNSTSGFMPCGAGWAVGSPRRRRKSPTTCSPPGSGLRQRWQTKRGPVGNQRIVDWITLNTDATIFPEAESRQLRADVGLVDYDFRWHVGDRTTLVSDGYFDFFDNAPKYATVGGFLNRPPRGSLYMGFHSLNGPITSNVLATSYSYRMSPKWISTFGTTYDLYQARNIGQNLTLTRIGESFLFMVNVNVDTSKGNVGANLAIQPRFLQGRLGGVAGQSPGMSVPVAGVYGLE